MAKRITTKKQKHFMHGGPLDGKVLLLSSEGTLPFTLHGQTGRYGARNQWIPAQVDNK